MSQNEFDPTVHHKAVLVDNGEYPCTCGWIANWAGGSWEEQFADHIREVKRIATLSDVDQIKYHIEAASQYRGFVDSDPARTLAWRLLRWGYTNTPNKKETNP